MVARSAMESKTISQKMCPMCSFEGPSVPNILSHLRVVHSHDAHFYVICGLGGCAATCKSFSSLYSHIYRKHSELISKRDKCTAETNQCWSESVSYENPSAILSDSPDIQCLLGSDVEFMRRKSALYLLKLKEQRKISQVAIDDIVSDSRDLFHHTITRVQANVKAKLAESGIIVDAIAGLDDAFTSVSDPFSGLETAYLQEKFYREQLCLIEPKEITIGETYYRHQFSGSKRRMVETKDKYYYIPLLSTVAQLLRDDSVLQQINESSDHIRQDGLIEDICDGAIFQSHPLFSTDPKSLQIIAYYDELEVVNPLGSHTKKHKLGIIFFTLANIKPCFRSQLKVMNLALVATTPIIEKYGLDRILEPFISDLNLLTTTGITVEINGSPMLFKGALLAFLADNLASNDLGGFKKSFSFSYRWCRTCLVTAESLLDGFVSTDYELRTLDSHLKHIESINGAASSHYSKTYGINRKSALLTVNYFSFFGGGLPHDAMHDLLEGIAPLEIKNLLHFHICINKSFTLAEYNDRLINFNYGYSDTDKPIPILSRILNSEQGLKSSASEMLTLLRILPFLVADRIPENDEHWKCFLFLRKVADIILCPVVSESIAASLTFLIKEHHSLFVHLYGESAYIPKLHFLLHYPDQMVAVGPMIRTWTMRHEAKLSFFKKASRLSNFKNISLSLANNHQRWMCYEMASGKLINNPLQCGPAKFGDGCSFVRDEPEEIKDCIAKTCLHVNEATPVYRPAWVCRQSTIYKEKAFVIIKSDGLDPIFGRIDDVLVIDVDYVMFVLSVVNILHFDDHFHAYAISVTATKKLLSLSDLPDYNVYHCHKMLDGLSYITLKYFFIS